MRAALLGFALACASSSSSRVAVRAETAVEAHATMETRIAEDRGPVVTVVEEFGAPAALPSRGSPDAEPMRPDLVRDTPHPRPAPIPTRRTTITQAPVHVATETHAVTAERATAVSTVAASATHEVHPSAGCGFSLGLVALPAAALLAYALWRFRPWIH